MKNRINYKAALVLGIILAFLIFIIALNVGQTYKGQTEILLLAKSEKTQIGLTRIMGNIQAIPQTLSFYDKLIENNSDIEDSAQGFEENKRREIWNSKINLEQIGESSVVRIEAFDENQFQAEVITNQLAKDIILVFSRYYNIKEELEIRIIDETVISRVYRGNIFILIPTSLLFGLLTAFIMLGIFTFIKRAISPEESQPDFFAKSREQLVKKGKEITSFSQRLAQNLREENEKKEQADFSIPEEPIYEFPLKKEEQKEEKPTPVESKELKPEIPKETPRPSAIPAPQSFSKKSGAPGNLPIADESVMKLFPTKKEKPQAPEVKKEEAEEKKSEGLYREATPEEVRERLNKLLKGKF